MKIIFATNNKHKIAEAMQVIGHLDMEVVTLQEVGIHEDIIEDGMTLSENATIKSRFVWDKLGVPVFSEDSGLEVDALDGAPGVHTARYAGDQKDAIDNMNLLLKNMEGLVDRSAQFRAVMSIIIDDKEHHVEGIVRGKIATKIAEGGGFGYDPIFIPDGYDKTFAELPNEVKISMSHRTKALQKLRAYIQL